MFTKVLAGLITGVLVGLFISSIFSPEDGIIDLFLTKITAAAIITGFICGLYSTLTHSKLKVFLVSILIGCIVFYAKYLITGNNLDPLTMGAFTGAMLGGVLSVMKQIKHRTQVYKRLRKLRKSGFNKS